MLDRSPDETPGGNAASASPDAGIQHAVVSRVKRARERGLD
jgi:hypothetical protein